MEKNKKEAGLKIDGSALFEIVKTALQKIEKEQILSLPTQQQIDAYRARLWLYAQDVTNLLIAVTALGKILEEECPECEFRDFLLNYIKNTLDLVEANDYEKMKQLVSLEIMTVNQEIKS